jgi:hypothetical protein
VTLGGKVSTLLTDVMLDIVRDAAVVSVDKDG